MTGRKPEFRAVVKIADKLWQNIGAGWTRDDKVSVQLNMTPVPQNGKMSFLLVPNGKGRETAEIAAE